MAKSRRSGKSSYSTTRKVTKVKKKDELCIQGMTRKEWTKALKEGISFNGGMVFAAPPANVWSVHWTDPFGNDVWFAGPAAERYLKADTNGPLWTAT